MLSVGPESTTKISGRCAGPEASSWIIKVSAENGTRRIPSPETGSRFHELAAVLFVLVTVSLLLWWRFLPLPHQDLNFYTEPAFLLAKFGTLTGPGSQYIDLTYQKGFYFYPPGHFLILAAWIKLFGLSPDSLLGFTHSVHVGILIVLWSLLRFRYGCSKLVSSLVLISIFPHMPHGRPDLPACFLSLAAWLALPDSENWPRIILSACLAGATLLVSPAFGVGILATLSILILGSPNLSFRARMRALAIWLVSSGLLFSLVLATVLSLQHSWVLAWVQFTTNVAIRGRQVNALPDMRLFYTWIFHLIPFVILGLVPAILFLLFQWHSSHKILRNVSLAFVGGTVAWLALNKNQLLLGHHYLFPAKSIFQGVFYSWPRFPLRLRVLPLLFLSAIGFYYYKSDFLYLSAPLRRVEQNSATKVQLQGEVAVDSFYFARFYRPNLTLNYETLNSWFWPRYLAAIPDSARHDMLANLQNKPIEPSMLIMSSATVRNFGEPRHDNIPCIYPPEFFGRLQLFGRIWNLPAQPYSMAICTSPVQMHSAIPKIVAAASGDANSKGKSP